MSQVPGDSPSPKSARRTKWMAGLLGGREIERRVDEDFPSWEEIAEPQGSEGESLRYAPPQGAELPAHRVFIRSPLHGNFVYVILVMVALVMGYTTPELAPILIYGAIGLSLVLALVVSFRDSLFFHMEGLRLQADGEMINRQSLGPSKPQEESDWGMLEFLRGMFGRDPKHIFRSKLMQVHYQNVLRTFEQGNRRTWVSQEAAIGELHTLLSQGGMKLVWTLIEVLPQLGLLGTLIGLMRMFLAFKTESGSPELEALAGFATALGTTVLANILVLILRPLYMRNERAMNEILTTLQSLMAMFILPTQQTVLERTGLGSMLALRERPVQPSGPAAGGAAQPLAEDGALTQQLANLTETLGEFIDVQQNVETGAVAKETAEVAKEVKETLKGFKDAMNKEHFERQQVAFVSLSESMSSLADSLKGVEKQGGGKGVKPSAGMERDLTQLRVLTHDTLVLLEQIAGQLSALTKRDQTMLSADRNLREKIFSMEAQSSGPGGRGRGGNR